MFNSEKKRGAAKGKVAEAGIAPMTTVTPVIAAHGGAGATTLCRWLGYYAQDWGMSVPPTFESSTVLVVCRSTAHGTARATELVRYLHSVLSDGRIVLALVSDGMGAEPTAARARVRALDPYIATVVRVPYVGRWRYEDDPLAVAAPPAYMEALQKLRAALEPDPNVGMPTRRQMWAPSTS